jgi:uncharacterized protein (DUF924 family)
MTPEAVVNFWTDAGSSRWFAKDDAFDADLRAHFEGAHHTAARGGFTEWEETPEGALALVLLLDQFPRNIFRGSAHAFATDPRAREVADRAIARGFDQRFEPALRCFFYLPFEHSEDAQDQARSLALFKALGDDNYLKYALLHRDIIARFGRFPHRNAVLGRVSTEEERVFLAGGGFAG